MRKIKFYFCFALFLNLTSATPFQTTDDVSTFESRLLLLSSLAEDQGGTMSMETTTQVQSVRPEGTSESSLITLTDTWWKICLWILAFLLIFGLCAFFSKCCYLVWDCCTDSYWGCCPRHESCKNCLLFKCCTKTKGKGKQRKNSKSYRKNKTYDFVSDDEFSREMVTIEPRNFPESKQQEQIVKHKIESEELREEDFTLRTLETSTDLIPLNNNTVEGSSPSVDHPDVSTLERFDQKSNSNQDKKVSPFFTSTPLRQPQQINKNYKRKSETENVQVIINLNQTDDSSSSRNRINSVFLAGDDTNEAGDEESLPQIHEGHYFNVFNLFKIGGARYEYRVARKQSQISNQSLDNTTERSKPDDSKFTMYSANANQQNHSHDTSCENEAPLLETGTLSSSWPSRSINNEEEKNKKKNRNKKNKKSSKSYEENVDTFLAANQNDFLLSDSFSNMSNAHHNHSNSKSQRSYGLFIEEGQVGRYNPLPEAQSELWPPQHMQAKMSTSQRSRNVSSSTSNVPQNEVLQRRSRSMDTFTKGLSKPSRCPAPRSVGRPLANGVQSQVDVCFSSSKTQSVDRKVLAKVSMEADEQKQKEIYSNGELKICPNEVDKICSNGDLEKSRQEKGREVNLSKRPPPVPIRMKKISSSIDNGVQCSEPPTPPPPLLIEDLAPRKHLQSLEEIFNFEKNILYGRETNL